MLLGDVFDVVGDVTRRDLVGRVEAAHELHVGREPLAPVDLVLGRLEQLREQRREEDLVDVGLGPIHRVRVRGVGGGRGLGARRRRRRLLALCRGRVVGERRGVGGAVAVAAVATVAVAAAVAVAAVAAGGTATSAAGASAVVAHVGRRLAPHVELLVVKVIRRLAVAAVLVANGLVLGLDQVLVLEHGPDGLGLDLEGLPRRRSATLGLLGLALTLLALLGHGGERLARRDQDLRAPVALAVDELELDRVLPLAELRNVAANAEPPVLQLVLGHVAVQNEQHLVVVRHLLAPLLRALLQQVGRLLELLVVGAGRLLGHHHLGLGLDAHHRHALARLLARLLLARFLDVVAAQQRRRIAHLGRHAWSWSWSLVLGVIVRPIIIVRATAALVAVVVLRR